MTANPLPDKRRGGVTKKHRAEHRRSNRWKIVVPVERDTHALGETWDLLELNDSRKRQSVLCMWARYNTNRVKVRQSAGTHTNATIAEYMNVPGRLVVECSMISECPESSNPTAMASETAVTATW